MHARSSSLPFLDRVHAGRCLGEELRRYRGEDLVVLGLPRGGVPVAFEVAQALRAPLDVIMVRKLGVPFQPELGMGAIGEDGVRVIDTRIVELAGVTHQELAAVQARERMELERRACRLRRGLPRVPLTDRTAVIVDDGIATGSAARAACRIVRAHGAARVVLAVPVASPVALDRVGRDADEVVCLAAPKDFSTIGRSYLDFSPTTDEEVGACLERAAVRPVPASPAVPASDTADPPDRDEEVELHAGRIRLDGRLTIPDGAPGVVVLADGSGSSHLNTRNRFVAAVLHEAGFGTLLCDLLTHEEELDRANAFDIALLADRLGDATRWLRSQPEAHDVPLGYFGTGTGAAAALWAATEPDLEVAAVVSRGGRLDLARPRLANVRAPTLLIVGGQDELVLEINQEARARLHCVSHLAVVAGASHLFEEPGTLREAAVLARDWFFSYLIAAPHLAGNR